MDPFVFRVARVKPETHDTFTLELSSKTRRKPTPFYPGQFNMLYLFGVGEIPISICGDPDRPHRLLHTTREVGAVTRALRKLKKGGEVGIRGPFGSPWPIKRAKGKDLVIVAGGIGLAPVRPVLHSVINHRQDFLRVILLYGARTPEDILYTKDLETWRSKFDLDVHITVDRGSLNWKGNIGVVTTLLSRSPFNPKNAVSMICGPEIMMKFTVMELQKRGIPDENITISMERNMKCAVGFCGHCQYGPHFICKNGPVFSFNQVSSLFGKREV